MPTEVVAGSPAAAVSAGASCTAGATAASILGFFGVSSDAVLLRFRPPIFGPSVAFLVASSALAASISSLLRFGFRIRPAAMNLSQ